MASLPAEFAEAETGVFWDIVDCEIPTDLSLDLICENIKSALANNGYRGKVSIRAYCDTKKNKSAVASAFKSSGIKLIRAGDRYSRLVKMMKDVFYFAGDHEPSNLMVIAQNISSESPRVKNLHFLREVKRNLLLAQNENVTEELFGIVSSIWYWRDLSAGGNPFHSQLIYKNNTRKFAKAVTGVFWDIVDCPIPDKLSVDLVCENLKSALAYDGYRGKVSIRAYGDMKKSKVAGASASEIKLVRAGDRRARRNAMLEDLVFFGVDNEPSSLMVICQDISKDRLIVGQLLSFKEKKRNLLLAQINDVTGELFGSVSSIWYWRDLSNGGKPAFQSGRFCGVDNNTSGSSQGVVDAYKWDLRRCDVNRNTSKSSERLATKRKRSTK